MSFMKKMLSSVGIGSAKVDTVLEETRYAPGETIHAVCHIKGGRVEQVIDDVYFSIHTTYREELDDDEVGFSERTAVLDKFKLGESVTVQPGEELEVELSFELPVDTPLTLGNSRVWVQTGLDIKRAVDPGDRDYIEVVPDPLMGALFKAIEDLGFELYEAENEAVHRMSNRLPFVQEFEFKPRRGLFRGKLDELEIIVMHRGDSMEVFMEIDRKARGFTGFVAEMLDRDEVRLRFELFEDNLDGLSDFIAEQIQAYEY